MDSLVIVTKCYETHCTVLRQAQAQDKPTGGSSLKPNTWHFPLQLCGKTPINFLGCKIHEIFLCVRISRFGLKAIASRWW